MNIDKLIFRIASAAGGLAGLIVAFYDESYPGGDGILLAMKAGFTGGAVGALVGFVVVSLRHNFQKYKKIIIATVILFAIVVLGMFALSYLTFDPFQAIKSSHQRQRAKAIDSLVNMNNPKAMAVLLEYGFVSAQVRDSFLKIDDQSMIDFIISELAHREALHRQAAAVALSRIRSSRAIAPLTKALQDKNINVRMAAVYALANQYDPQAVAALTDAALKNTEKSIMRTATEMLAVIDNPDSEAMLVSHQNDENKAVRDAANDALYQIRQSRQFAKKTEYRCDEHNYQVFWSRSGYRGQVERVLLSSGESIRELDHVLILKKIECQPQGFIITANVGSDEKSEKIFTLTFINKDKYMID